MSRDPRAAPLRSVLLAHAPGEGREADDTAATLSFLEQVERPFDEMAQPAHVTASAFVVSPLGVVLHRHRLLGIWVQPGGHVDPGEAPEDACTREVREETGLASSHLSPPALVHVNVHPGPRGHLHYDCRWLVVAEGTSLAPGDAESHELGWFLPDAALERCEPELRDGLRRAFGAARAARLAAVASWPS